MMEFADVAPNVAELVAIGLIELQSIRGPARRPAPRPEPARIAPISLDAFDVIPKSAATAMPVPSRVMLETVKRRILDL
jgi:hypothetical protein